MVDTSDPEDPATRYRNSTARKRSEIDGKGIVRKSQARYACVLVEFTTTTKRDQQ